MASSVPREAVWVFAGLGAVLLVASSIALVLQLRYRGKILPGALENLHARIKAWWVMISVVGIALWLGPLVFTAVFCLLSAIALRELQILAPEHSRDNLIQWISLVVFVPVQYALVADGSYQWLGVFIPLVALLALPVLAIITGRSGHFLQRVAEAQWGLMICAYCISYVPAILWLDIPGYSGRNALLVIFLLLVVQSSDVLQYVCGKLFGRRPIAPRLSPSKTVEGFVGGILLATATGTALWQITPYSPFAALGMALTITLMGFLGGLAMSAIKRDHGVKDWGGAIKGHGGVLDRLDSVCFSAPVLFHATRYFYGP